MESRSVATIVPGCALLVEREASRPSRRARWLAAGGLALVLTLPSLATAAEGFGVAAFENWGFFQRNGNGTTQWQDDLRLYLRWHLEGGATFTQRIDLPLLYTNATGPGHPEPGYSGGVGDAYIEEIYDSAEIGPNLRWRASVRFVFPTGKQKPFGSSQYQWGPGVGLHWGLPHAGEGVALRPFLRYLSGFAPQEPGVDDVRKLELYPAADFSLGGGWMLEWYPQNPIVYDAAKRSWFVPLDAMLSRRLGRNLDLGLGGAYAPGSVSASNFRYLIDARITWRF